MVRRDFELVSGMSVVLGHSGIVFQATTRLLQCLRPIKGVWGRTVDVRHASHLINLAFQSSVLVQSWVIGEPRSLPPFFINVRAAEMPCYHHCVSQSCSASFSLAPYTSTPLEFARERFAPLKRVLRKWIPKSL